MQERQRLEDMIGAIRGFDQTLEDSVELIAMGEEEDDQETIADAEKAEIADDALALIPRAAEGSARETRLRPKSGEGFDAHYIRERVLNYRPSEHFLMLTVAV